MSITTGIVLFDGAEELDWAGPFEVFAMARRDGDSVVTIAETTEPVVGANGLRVLADHTFADAPTLDVLLVPGGQGSRRERTNPAMLEFVRRVAPGCTWVTSVCTGVFVLHGAGLVREQRVTTHWGAIEELRRHRAGPRGRGTDPVGPGRQRGDLGGRERRDRHGALARRPARLGGARPVHPVRSWNTTPRRRTPNRSETPGPLGLKCASERVDAPENLPRGVMDQLPVEISQRIRHEARVAGLSEHAPSIEMVERRRLQLWSLTIVVIIALGLAALAVSGATRQRRAGSPASP